jgi:hypothetical protein
MSNETEADKKDEKERSKVSVAMGDFKVELEGTHGNVKKLMGNPLYKFIQGLQDIFGEISSVEVEKTQEKTPPTEYPPPISKTKTLTDAIKILMDSDWARKPRTFAEILEALKISGIYYSKGALSATLNHLVKSGTLRRMGKRRSFKYVAA